MDGRLRVSVLEEEVGLEGLGTEWNQLLNQSSNDTVFLTWEWVRSWWSSYGNARDLLIIKVERDGELWSGAAVPRILLQERLGDEMRPWRPFRAGISELLCRGRQEASKSLKRVGAIGGRNGQPYAVLKEMAPGSAPAEIHALVAVDSLLGGSGNPFLLECPDQ